LYKKTSYPKALFPQFLKDPCVKQSYPFGFGSFGKKLGFKAERVLKYNYKYKKT